MILVRDEEGLERLKHRLLYKRDTATVVLTQLEEADEPVLPLDGVRSVVGPEARIYLICADSLLQRLRWSLGGPLAVKRGTLRIYWPGLSLQSDPFSHPLIPILAGEPTERSLEELKRAFELSRPYVRSEIKLIEDARTVLQDKVTRLETELDAMRTQCHSGSSCRGGRAAASRREREQMSSLPAKRQIQTLVGVRLPSVALYSFDRQAPPYTLGYEWMAIYFFPGIQLHTGSEPDSADAEVAHHCAFRDHERELAEAGIDTVGISSQSPQEQLETIRANRLCHPILSDPALELARGLGLPTSSHGREERYQPLTLLTQDQVVVWVIYPVNDPYAAPRQILTWLKLNSYEA